MAELDEQDLFPDEGVKVIELTPEDLMKTGKEVVDHYKDVERCKRAISNLLQANSAGFARDKDVSV